MAVRGWKDTPSAGVAVPEFGSSEAFDHDLEEGSDSVLNRNRHGRPYLRLGALGRSSIRLACA